MIKEFKKLALNLFYTFGIVNNHYSSVLKEFGLTTHQYNILRLLNERYPEPVSIVILRDCMPDKQSDVSRLVDRMVKAGLVERKECPLDRRKVDVTINEMGRELLLQIQSSEDKLDDIFIHISPSEAEQVNILLDKINKLDDSSKNHCES